MIWLGWLTRLAFAASLSLASPAFAAAEGYDDAAFTAALAKAKANDPATDYAWLRQQNLLRSDYSIEPWDETKAAFGAIDKKPEKALKLAREQLESDYFNLFAHVVAEQSLTKLGQTDAAAAEHNTVVAILASIMGGNDGRSAEHAFKVVSVGEEYQTLSLLGFDVSNQSLSNAGGHVYDVLDAVDSETKETVSIWFEIDSFFGKEFGL